MILRRFYSKTPATSSSGSLNSLSSFFKKALFGAGSDEGTQPTPKRLSQPVSNQNIKFYRASNEEITETVKTIGTSLLSTTTDNWTNIDISDLDVKSKVLCQCEKKLRRTIPSRSLSSIKTLGELVNFLHSPPLKPPGLVFADLRGKRLPVNLSVEFPKRMPTRRAPYRKPFQNYDDPSHSDFPNKKKKFHKQYHYSPRNKASKYYTH